MVQRVVVAHQIPADLVVVAPVHRAREETGDGVRAHEVEERRALDVCEYLNLLIVDQVGEFRHARKAAIGMASQLVEPGGVVLLPIPLEGHERPVDEVHDPSLARSGSVVGRDDLRGHRVELHGLLGREEREADLTGGGLRADVLLGLEDGRPVGGDPHAPRPWAEPMRNERRDFPGRPWQPPGA